MLSSPLRQPCSPDPESLTVRKPHPQIPTWTADKFARLGLSLGLNWLGGGGGGGGAGKIPWTDSITYSCSSMPKAVCWLQRLETLQLSSFRKKKKKKGRRPLENVSSRTDILMKSCLVHVQISVSGWIFRLVSLGWAPLSGFDHWSMRAAHSIPKL